MEATINKRNYGIDLLRILSMFMVVLLHILGNGGILKSVTLFSAKYDISWVIEIGAYCAVNCYALISGYVNLKSKHKYTSFAVLWLQVAFYTLLITAIYFFISPSNISIKLILNALFPVFNSQYWYFTSYFILFLFKPILNKAILELERKQLKTALLILFVVLTVIPTLMQKEIFSLSFGYNAWWLIYLYLIGGYIKKYECFDKIKKSTAIVGYLSCVAITFLVMFVLEHLNLSKYSRILIKYTSPTIVLSAIFLFIFFKQLNFNHVVNKLISVFAPLSFSVYLIHTHPLVWEYIIKNRFIGYIKLSAIIFVLSIFGTALGIYFICTFIDLIRQFLFKSLKIKDRIFKLEQKLLKIN